MNKKELIKERSYIIFMNKNKYHLINRNNIEFKDPENLSNGSIDDEVNKAIKEFGPDFMILESNSPNPNDGKLVEVYKSNKPLKNYKQLTFQVLAGLSYPFAGLSNDKLEGLANGYAKRSLRPKKY